MTPSFMCQQWRTVPFPPRFAIELCQALRKVGLATQAQCICEYTYRHPQNYGQAPQLAWQLKAAPEIGIKLTAEDKVKVVDKLTAEMGRFDAGATSAVY
jgi:hypothetical protein